MDDFDQRVRLAAFAFLDALQRAPGGDLLSRDALIRGFEFEGRRVPLVSPQQGIFKPAILPSIPLSILTAPVVEGRERPYDDAVGRDGLLEYRYRGTDINHRDNAGLRAAMEHQTPLVYFMGIVPGKLRGGKLHHSAFDAHIMGVRPDYVIEIREDVLREVDGPMLIHGLQGWNGKALRVPRHAVSRPSW